MPITTEKRVVITPRIGGTTTFLEKSNTQWRHEICVIHCKLKWWALNWAPQTLVTIYNQTWKAEQWEYLANLPVGTGVHIDTWQTWPVGLLTYCKPSNKFICDITINIISECQWSSNIFWVNSSNFTKTNFRFIGIYANIFVSVLSLFSLPSRTVFPAVQPNLPIVLNNLHASQFPEPSLTVRIPAEIARAKGGL